MSAFYISRPETMRLLSFFSGGIIGVDAALVDCWTAPWFVMLGVSFALYIGSTFVGDAR